MKIKPSSQHQSKQSKGEQVNEFFKILSERLGSGKSKKEGEAPVPVRSFSASRSIGISRKSVSHDEREKHLDDTLVHDPKVRPVKQTSIKLEDPSVLEALFQDPKEEPPLPDYLRLPGPQPSQLSAGSPLLPEASQPEPPTAVP